MRAIPENTSPWQFCLAPMMQRTDKHFRHLVSLIAPHMRLYTEMLTPNAIIFGNRDKLLEFSKNQSPLALQLGGSVPEHLLESAYIAVDYGYDEINLNCGCPSDRVQSGQFGACLMREPKIISNCVSLLRSKLPKNIAVTVKTRLGIDDIYSYEYLKRFIAQLIESGVNVFHMHARKALLQGLSPRENREIPPLNYQWVYRLKKDFPTKTFVLNGGLTDFSAITTHLKKVDGVMLGRHAYSDPYSLMEFDSKLFKTNSLPPSRSEIVKLYIQHMELELAKGVPLRNMSRHIINLFHAQPKSKTWRQALTVKPRNTTLNITTIARALKSVTTI